MNAIIKLIVAVLVMMILLNIFSPETASKINENVSEASGIKKETLDSKLNSATDTAKTLTNKIKDETIEDINKMKRIFE